MSNLAVIPPQELLRLVRERKLVEGLCDRELQNPEGAGFDLRLGEIYRPKGSAFLGVEERSTPQVDTLAVYGKDARFVVKPGDYLLAKTIEKVNLPSDVVMYAFPRSTLHRSGILLLATQTAPGYSGPLVFGLKNLSECEVTLEMGARFAHVQFHTLAGEGVAYRGQWAGGRVTTGAREQQV